MDNKKWVNEKFKEIAQYRQMKKQTEAMLEELESEIKEYMLENNCDELIGDEHSATYKITKVFDDKMLMIEMPDVYEEYSYTKLDVTRLKKASPEVHERFSVDGKSRRFNFA